MHLKYKTIKSAKLIKVPLVYVYLIKDYSLVDLVIKWHLFNSKFGL